MVLVLLSFYKIYIFNTLDCNKVGLHNLIVFMFVLPYNIFIK